MITAYPAIIGAAGASVAAGLVLRLVEKGILTKTDALDIYNTILRAKEAKAQLGETFLGHSETEFAIADVIVGMIVRFEQQFP